MEENKYTYVSHAKKDRRTDEEKKVAIEWIKKGFYATNTVADNPELLLSALLISEGLLDPEVSELSDTLSVEQILAIIIDKTAYSGVAEWEVSVRIRRDMALEQAWNGRGYGNEKIFIHKSFIIEGKIDHNHSIYASESTVLDAVRSIQRSVAGIYIRNNQPTCT